ncbi:hypothetical protein H4R19_004872, partial [Coemansia spiralis]
ADLGDDDDDDGWEDGGGGDSLDEPSAGPDYGLLSGYAGGADLVYSDDGEGCDDDDEDDEDIQADPIYNQDLNVALGSFLKELVHSGHPDFNVSIEPLLTDRERKTLAKVCA